MRNPYDVLGVQREATEAEIKKAFRKLAKAIPSRPQQGRPQGEGPLLRDQRRLRDPRRRRTSAPSSTAARSTRRASRVPGLRGLSHGAGGRAAARGLRGHVRLRRRRPAPAARPRRRLGGHLLALFGEAFRSSQEGTARRSRKLKGEDIEATLTVTLEDVASEEKKRIALPTGRDVDVVIPKGVGDGQVIRLRGLGYAVPGGEPGDLLLKIAFAPHERFTVEGANLRVRLALDLEEAMLGGEVRVPTLTGAVSMTVPPMTQSGRVFRLRGKGLPGKSATGDLLATAEIRLPETADEALTEWARKRKEAEV